MSRTLHTNPRNYREPFYLLKNEIVKIDGVDVTQNFKRILMWGNIRNKIATTNEAYNINIQTILSIKIIKPNLNIKIGDTILYRNQHYVISSIEYDLYSYSEMILNCEYQNEMNEGSPYV